MPQPRTSDRGFFSLSIAFHLVLLTVLLWEQNVEIEDGPAAGFPGLPGGGGGGGGPEITMMFDNGPLAPGEQFELRYTVNHLGFPFGPSGPPADLPDGFFLYQHPLPVPIPAPGAVALAMIGFGIIGCRRRSI